MSIQIVECRPWWHVMDGETTEQASQIWNLAVTFDAVLTSEQRRKFVDSWVLADGFLGKPKFDQESDKLDIVGLTGNRDHGAEVLRKQIAGILEAL